MAEPTPKRVKGTKASGNAATRGRRSGKSVALSIFKWLGAFVVLGGIAALAAFGVIATTEIPDPNKDFQTNVTRVYYSAERPRSAPSPSRTASRSRSTRCRSTPRTPSSPPRTRRSGPTPASPSPASCAPCRLPSRPAPTRSEVRRSPSST